MAHAEERGDVCHRQPVAVGLPDRLVSCDPQLRSAALELLFLLRVVSSELGEPAMRFRCFALWARDRRIVERISTN